MQKGFWTGFLIIQIVILVYSLLLSKLNQILVINRSHTFIGDSLFEFLSFSAEILIPTLLFIYALLKKRTQVVPLLISFVAVTVIVQLLKHQIFPDLTRPMLYFANQNIDFYTVKGQIIHQRNTFPSGHTASAWWIVFWLNNFFAKTFKQALLITSFGFGVALSRVYLLQHFPLDTLAGGIIGALIPVGVYKLYEKKWFKRVDN